MATNSGVRSPFFYSISYTGGERWELTVTINGTLRYTLVKVTSNEAHFDVAELIRDYINITYDGTMPTGTEIADSANGYSADVSLAYEVWTNPEGTGSPASFGGFTFDAYDAYSLFEDQDDDYNLPSTGVLLTSKTVWLPEDTAGKFYFVVSSVIDDQDILTTDGDGTTITPTGSGETVTIRRYPCSKYDAKKLDRDWETTK